MHGLDASILRKCQFWAPSLLFLGEKSWLSLGKTSPLTTTCFSKHNQTDECPQHQQKCETCQVFKDEAKKKSVCVLVAQESESENQQEKFSLCPGSRESGKSGIVQCFVWPFHVILIQRWFMLNRAWTTNLIYCLKFSRTFREELNPVLKQRVHLPQLPVWYLQFSRLFVLCRSLRAFCWKS